mgnify:CR=1 FL=1
MSELIKIDTAVTIPNGLHFRVIGEIQRLAKEFDVRLFVQKNSNKENMESVLKVFALGITKGEHVQFSYEGPEIVLLKDNLIALVNP